MVHFRISHISRVIPPLTVDARGIICTRLDRTTYRLDFHRTDDGKIVVVSDDGSGHKVMTADEAANYILHRIEDDLDSRKELVSPR